MNSTTFDTATMTRTKDAKPGFNRWVRLLVALVLGTPVAVGAIQALPVAATGAAFVPTTAFAIDGNPAGPNDFDAGYGPGVTPDGLATTGLYYNHRSVDQGGVSGCSLAADDTASGGTKISDGPVWPTGGPNPNGKTDINWVDIAAEKVDVNGQINDVLYVGYEKCGGNGTWQAMLYLDDGDGLPPTGGDLNGDYLFVFDFNPSSGAVSIVMHRLIGGVWTPQVMQASAIDGRAALDYGEVALNLTPLGIVSESTCRGVNVSGQAAAITGGDLSSAVKDLVQVQPLLISNCGALAVNKVSSPAGVSSAASFHYVVDQSPQISAADLDVVHDGSLAVNLGGSGTSTEPDANFAEFDANILIGGVHNWSNVISQSDYRIVEDAIPSGWTLNRIVCSYTDIFVSPPAVTSVVIYQNGAYTGNDFLIPPASLGNVAIAPASCVITNATSGVKIVKAGTGAPTTFDFTANGTPVSVALGGSSSVIAFTPGTDVTIVELAEAATPGWNLTGLDCDDPANATPSGGSITVKTVAASVITCTFTNTQNGRISIDKAGLPGDSAQAFGFSIAGPTTTPNLTGLTIPGAAVSTGDLAPGTYTITELAPPVDADWSLVDIVCDNEANQDLVAQTIQVTVAAGQTVNCTFVNHQRGPVTIDKTAVAAPTLVPGTIDQYDVSYTVTAHSDSYVAESISVTDAFGFPAALTLVGSPVVSGASSTAGWNGTTNTNLFSGSIPARGDLVWTVSARVRLAITATPADRACTASGHGAWNHVDLAVDTVKVDQADACVAFGNPIISITKDVVGAVTVNPDHSMSVAYSIVVDNAGTGPGSYQLTDSFGFPSWVHVTGATGSNAGVGSVAITTSTSGATTGSAAIGAGGRHTYTITVTFTADPTVTTTDADCVTATRGNGLFNLASITATSGPRSDDACISIPRGRIVVTKATFGGTGGFTFTSSVPGTLINGQSITTTTSEGVASGNTLSAYVTPGSYAVTEAAVAGWTQIATPCGTVSVANAATSTCNFVNGKQGSITVIKIADPSGTFEFTLSGRPAQSVASGPTGFTWTSLDQGDFDLTETPRTAWRLVGADCGNASTTDIANGKTIALGWGQNVTCTFSNEAFGEIVVAKVTIPGTTPAATKFEFNPSWSDTNLLVGNGESVSSGQLVAGTYSVAELVPAGWDLTGLICSASSVLTESNNGSTAVYANPSATITLEPGDKVTCTFTNTERGSIIIDKVTLPGTDTTAFDFTLGGDATGNFTVTGPGAPHNTGSIPPGTYTVTELAEAGWAFQGAVCDSEGADVVGATATITLGAGEIVTCTYTNARRGPLSITKTVTAGPTRVDVDTYETTYQVTVTSASYIAETYDLNDTIQFGGGVTVLGATASGPSGVALLSGWNGTTSTALVDDGVLAPLATQLFTVRVTGRVGTTSTVASRDCVLAAGETGTGFLNTATVTFTGGSATDDACAEIPGPDDADLAIVKTASVAQVGAGGGFNWVLDITNNGPGVAVNVKVGDIVPSRLTVTGVSSSQFTCSHVGNTVSCTKPSMAVGETGKVTVAVVVPATGVGGVVVNVGTVTADTPDPNLVNNSDDASVDVVAQQAPPTALPPVVLPPTGSNSTGPLLQAALMLLLMGGGIVLITRRRTQTNIGS